MRGVYADGGCGTTVDRTRDGDTQYLLDTVEKAVKQNKRSWLIARLCVACGDAELLLDKLKFSKMTGARFVIAKAKE